MKTAYFWREKSRSKIVFICHMENLACSNICLAVGPGMAKVVKKILNFDWIGMSEAEFLKAGSTNPPTFDPGLRCYITIRLRKLLIDPYVLLDI